MGGPCAQGGPGIWPGSAAAGPAGGEGLPGVPGQQGPLPAEGRRPGSRVSEEEAVQASVAAGIVGAWQPLETPSLSAWAMILEARP